MDVPEVRQCQDAEHEHFGAVAVRGENGWCVMNPGLVDRRRLGGHTDGTDDEVKDWTPLQSATTQENA